MHNTAPQDGYTNQGRYIGAGIGPGSNSLMINLNFTNNLNSFGMTMERLIHNNDLYYTQASSGFNIYTRQWVDLSNTFYANLKLNKYLLSASLTPVYTLNYQYATGTSVNWQGSLNITYFFD